MEHAASPGVAEGAVGFLQSIADVVESLGEFGSWQKVPAGLRRGCAVSRRAFRSEGLFLVSQLEARALRVFE